MQTSQRDAEYSKDTDEDFKPRNYVCVFCSLRKALSVVVRTISDVFSLKASFVPNNVGQSLIIRPDVSRTGNPKTLNSQRVQEEAKKIAMLSFPLRSLQALWARNDNPGSPTQTFYLPRKPSETEYLPYALL